MATMKKKQLIFLSFYDENYSRSSVLLNADDVRFQKIYYRLSNNSISAIREFKKIVKAHKGQIVAVVVMSPSHKVVPVIRIFCRYPLILDAGWPLTDGSVSRRGSEFRWLPKTIINYLKLLLIDCLSFRLADLVLVETLEQRKRMNNKLLFQGANLKVSFTGFNEQGQVLNPNKAASKFSNNHEFKISRTRILFRGKINLESGFNNIVQAFKLLSDSFEILYVVNHIPHNHVLLPNEEFITDFVNSDLTSIYNRADICIGQVSSHQRLGVTIPHKAFEAAYFSKPYISADSAGIREFASDEDVLFLDSTAPEAISEAIIKIASNPKLKHQLEKNFRAKYEKLASQGALLSQFEEFVTELTQSSFHRTYLP